MAKKIYLSPSSQDANAYSYGDTFESEQCRRISAATAEALKRCGFEPKNANYGTMYSRVAESNEWGSDLHVPIHTNAFNEKVTGTRIMCYDMSGEGYKASKAVFDVLAPITPGISENITAQPGLYEIKKSKAPCVYVEVDFHDVPEIAQWIIENTVVIGEAICKGICNYYGMKYVEPAADKEPDVFYRVQVGAFVKKQYADIVARDLQNAGYKDAFVVQVKK